ncbi:MAG: TSUP family transporter, partial [Betaproteobacteria bacterium]
MLGIGGGVILVPLLVFIFTAQHFPDDRVVHLALGTSLASIVFTNLTSMRAHH